MCEVVSFFVSDTEVVSAHPSSHRRTQGDLNLKLDKREQWSEGEWGEGKEPTVRHTNPTIARKRKSVLLATHPTRSDLIEAMRPSWEMHGHYLVESAEDAARVPAVVSGNLIVRSMVPMPQLVRVRGILDAFTLTRAEGMFPLLESVGGGLVLTSLVSARGVFPSLVRVGGAIHLFSLTDAKGVFPSLAYVGGSIYTGSMSRKKRVGFTARVAAKHNVTQQQGVTS